MSGIACAHKLLNLDNSVDITILESREVSSIPFKSFVLIIQRIGGRVHSIKFGTKMVERGASWIHGIKTYKNTQFKVLFKVQQEIL